MLWKISSPSSPCFITTTVVPFSGAAHRSADRGCTGAAHRYDSVNGAGMKQMGKKMSNICTIEDIHCIMI